MPPREVTEPVQLSDKNGQINEESFGWARHPLINCNVKGSFLRKKKWNYWCVTSPEVLFSATISHIDYAAVMFVYILDLKTLDFYEKTSLVPFGKSIHMPAEVRDSVSYTSKELTLQFTESGNDTAIYVHCPNFNGKGKVLTADIVLTRPEAYESLNVVVPWRKKRYQFTSKQPAIPASGDILWYDKAYKLNGEEAFGCLDFGRGKWKYHTTWNWASASGVVNDVRIGLNFGGQWTDGTGQNENGLIVNDQLHKIHENITWDYDTDYFMKPWTLKTKESDRVSLVFKPIYERKAITNVLIVQSTVHQLIGHFQGTVTTDEGDVIRIKNMLGWAEDHMAKW